jgi:ribosomal protein L7/L12
MPRCPFCEKTVASGSASCPNCGAALPTDDSVAAPSGSLPKQSPADFESELLTLLQQGSKIEAIRRHRERTGAGLKEAKEAVEALERTGRLAAGPGSGPGPAGDSNFETALLALLQRGEKIQAIKQYREQTNAGLKEAKEAVEALAARHGIVAKSAGCAGMILFWLTVATLATVASRF